MITLRLENRSPFGKVYSILALEELVGLLQISSQLDTVIDIISSIFIFILLLYSKGAVISLHFNYQPF